MPLQSGTPGIVTDPDQPSPAPGAGEDASAELAGVFEALVAAFEALIAGPVVETPPADGSAVSHALPEAAVPDETEAADAAVRVVFDPVPAPADGEATSGSLAPTPRVGDVLPAGLPQVDASEDQQEVAPASGETRGPGPAEGTSSSEGTSSWAGTAGVWVPTPGPDRGLRKDAPDFESGNPLPELVPAGARTDAFPTEPEEPEGADDEPAVGPSAVQLTQALHPGVAHPDAGPGAEVGDSPGTETLPLSHPPAQRSRIARSGSASGLKQGAESSGGPADSVRTPREGRILPSEMPVSEDDAGRRTVPADSAASSPTGVVRDGEAGTVPRVAELESVEKPAEGTATARSAAPAGDGAKQVPVRLDSVPDAERSTSEEPAPEALARSLAAADRAVLNSAGVPHAQVVDSVFDRAHPQKMETAPPDPHSRMDSVEPSDTPVRVGAAELRRELHGDVIRVRLQSELLGRIDLHAVSNDNGHIQARIGAERAEVQQLLKGELPDLAQALNNRQLSVDELSVDVSEYGSFGADDGAGHGSASGDAPASPEPEFEASSATPIRVADNLVADEPMLAESTGRLDLRA